MKEQVSKTTENTHSNHKKAAGVIGAVLIAGGAVGGVEAYTHTGDSSARVHAQELAHTISTELYDSTNFPKGVEVPGILNGAVVLHTAEGQTITYRYPVILEQATLNKKPDSNGKFLEGSWIGIPSHNAKGQVVITPTQVKLGASKEIADESVSIASSTADTIHPAAGLYATTVTGGPDQLMAFDIQGNGNFPSVPVEAAVDK
jgi:hypothetical protein